MTDLVGHIAYLTIFLGQVMLTKKHLSGWIVRAVGDITWCILGVFMGLTCVWTWGLFFLVSDYRGWKEWRAVE